MNKRLPPIALELIAAAALTVVAVLVLELIGRNA